MLIRGMTKESTRREMRVITEIIIHCADTPNGRNVTKADIEQWHKERGQWDPSPLTGQYCGYHWIINIDGTVESGRLVDEVGAHCPPNGKSLGICIPGKDKFPMAVWDSLKVLVDGLAKEFRCKVTGHYEHDSAKKQGKTCPNFDVRSWVADGYVPDNKNVLYRRH